MKDKGIAGKSLNEWVGDYPLLNEIVNRDETFWANPQYCDFQLAYDKVSLSAEDIKDAEERLVRFAPYIARVFPETDVTGGIIESPLKNIAAMQQGLAQELKKEVTGKLLLKCDSHLAISGSIKARGGIYEVLKHAEDLALQHQLISITDDYAVMDSDEVRSFFSHYSISVGSTGNLGLSIGIISARLGFRVFVHMSADAKQWKKDLLRQKGVTVIEHQSDYSKAVEEARNQADADPTMHFVDDENSTDLFLGYAVAASRLAQQLSDLNIIVDKEHPLFVYLPCGVGGGPGGITFGLKNLFKDHVHCFFAEPVSSPCMLLGLMTRLHDQISVHDFGLTNQTDADGLAVGRASGFVGKTLEEMISGVYTVKDSTLYTLLTMLSDSEKIHLEPSALAGMAGIYKLLHTTSGNNYLKEHALHQHMAQATHIVWATGGNMVPANIMDEYYQKGLNSKKPLVI